MLSVAQANAVFEPLRVGITQMPPIQSNYRLVADLWNHSSLSLTPDEMTWFEQGLRLFPRDVTLLYEGAMVALYRGDKAEARSRVARGLHLVNDDSMRERLEKLQATLEPTP
jgi:hypothetical protein